MMGQTSERSTQPEREVVTQWLVHQAARRAPACLSSRLEEEWLADLACRVSAASRLRFAVGCCWATAIIVNDHSCGRDPTPIPVPAAKGFMTSPERDYNYFSLRSATLFLIVGLHAAVFCGLITTVSN